MQILVCNQCNKLGYDEYKKIIVIHTICNECKTKVIKESVNILNDKKTN